MSADATPPPAPDPTALLRSRQYVVLVVLGGVIGVPVATVAYFFLQAVSKAQTWLFTTLPHDLDLKPVPDWWPLPLLVLAGLLVALTITYLPGTAGHKPAEGLKAGGIIMPIELPGIFLASFFTLSLGVVLGPEAPLIAIGSGLGVLAIHLVKKDAPESASMLIGAAGSFAAVSTLLGSPLVGAFLLMEAAGLGGPMMGVVLIPGLLAAGIGSLIFIGLNSWTGYGTFSLQIPNLPAFGTPTGAEFLWAIAIGLIATVIGTIIRRLGLRLQTIVEPRMIMLMPVMGLGIGLLVWLFAATTDKPTSYVLFSGQDGLPGLIGTATDWSVGALVMLIVCKGLAYALSLSSFRGGPVFPGMFVGAAMGIALSHLPGLPMIAGAAMGIGAMTTVMLGLPLTSVLLVTLLLSADGVALMPLVIVAVTVAYVASAHVSPLPKAARAA